MDQNIAYQESQKGLGFESRLQEYVSSTIFIEIEYTMDRWTKLETLTYVPMPSLAHRKLQPHIIPMYLSGLSFYHLAQQLK